MLTIDSKEKQKKKKVKYMSKEKYISQGFKESYPELFWTYRYM